MPDVPPKAWLRAISGSLAAVVALGAPVIAALGTQGPARIAFVALALAVLALVVAVLWLYLPDVDLPGRTIRSGPRGTRAIAITFDDGPDPVHTPRILDVLARHGARATFFCVGASVRQAPALARRMAREGHELGNHTFTHRLLPRAARADVEQEVADTQAAFVRIGLPRPRLFRAPKGFKSFFLPAVLRREGLRLVGWSRGVWDTDRPGAEVIARRAARALVPGAILLLHDGLAGRDRSQTVAALDAILAECARRELTCVTISQLLSSDSYSERTSTRRGTRLVSRP